MLQSDPAQPGTHHRRKCSSGRRSDSVGIPEPAMNDACTSTALTYSLLRYCCFDDVLSSCILINVTARVVWHQAAITRRTPHACLSRHAIPQAPPPIFFPGDERYTRASTSVRHVRGRCNARCHAGVVSRDSHRKAGRGGQRASWTRNDAAQGSRLEHTHKETAGHHGPATLPHRIKICLYLTSLTHPLAPGYTDTLAMRPRRPRGPL